MTPLTVSKQTPLSEVIALMSRDRQTCHLTCDVTSHTAAVNASKAYFPETLSSVMSCVIVVENSKPIGIVTERDLVHLAATENTIANRTVETVMTSPIITVGQKQANDLFSVLDILQQQQIRHLPIVDKHEQLVGVLTRESIRQSLQPSDLLCLHYAAETMTRDVIQAAPTVNLMLIAQLMTQHQVSCVVITETIEDKTYSLGIITEGDIVQFQALQLDFATLTAQAVMSHPVFCASPRLSLWQAHQLMLEYRITHLVITHENGSLAGILTQTTILQVLNPAEMFEVICMLRQQLERLESEKLQLLEARNTQLGQAVKLKTADLEQQNKFERLLADINNRIRSSLDFNTVLTTTVNVLQESLGVDRALVYRFNPDWSGQIVVESVADAQWSLLNREFFDPCFLDQAAALFGTTTIKAVANIYDSSLQDCYVEFLAQLNVKSSLVTAIAHDDQLWGLLILHNCHAIHDWHDHEIELIRKVGGQLAISLRQATTHKALQNELATHQQTEFLLRESEQRYASLTAVVPVVIFRTDLSGACIYINEYWTDLTGISQQEALGQGWLKLLYSVDYDQVMTTWQQAIQTGQSFKQEYRLQLLDGSIKWVYDHTQPEYDVTGKICGYVGSLTDISDRKQAELSLRESEQRFRRAIAEAPMPIMLHAEDGEVLQISSTWTELTGYTHADISTTQAWIERAYSEPEASDIATKISQQYGLKSRLEEGDATITTQDGQQRIWNFSSASLGTLLDGRRMAIVMAADITEKHQAQTALQVSENRYRALVEVIPDLLIRQDAEGNYLDLVMSNEVRFIQPDLVHSEINIYDLLPLELAQQRMDYVHQALKTGKVQLYDFEIVIREERRWQEARIIAINQTEVLVIVRDISQRKRAELQRQQTDTSLRQIVEGTAAVTEQDFFQELVQHISRALDVRYTSVSEAKSDRFKILAFCADGDLQKIDDCPFDQFPCCVQALQQGQCCYPDSLLQVYPDNTTFNDLNAESYLGIGLRNSMGEPIGHLCIIHDRPLNNPEWMINLLKIFGARASAELERYQTARQLQELTTKLEQRVTERTSTLAKTVDHLQTEIQRRQALENLLLQSQSQLQDIFDSAHDMIQSVSLTDGSFEFVNRSWLDTLGYTAQDLERLTIFDVLHPSCQEHCMKVMQQLKTGQLQSLDQVEISFVTQDGRTIEAEGNVNCRIVNGQPVYTRGFFRDISERKKNEAELYNLSMRLSLAVKSGGIGIWEWDFINERLTWDDHMYELYGIQPEAFTGQIADWSNRVHPDDIAEAQAKFQQAINAQKELDIEFRIIHPNGQLRYIKANGLVQHNGKGELQHVIGINFDISDLKKAETEIIKALERERELSEMKSRFVSNTSHEFRTPLTVISSNTELLKLFGDKLDETEKQKCLDTILNYVDHTTELIDDVLIVSKAESGKIQLNLKSLNIVDFSQEISQAIGLSAPNHSLEFVIQDVRSQLKKHIHSAQLDSKILQQSLTNLLTNAIKYSPEGSKITFELKLLPDTIQFGVIDEGMGISEEDQRYLFEPFHRATNVGAIPGTGLGLSIVKRLITVHQGSINVKSTLGEGSCFTITIPTQWQEIDP